MSEVKTIDKTVAKRLEFSIAQPSYVRPKVNEVKLNGGYMSFGADNKYPDYLINIYYGSSQHQGIIQRKVDEVLGKGLMSKSGNGDLKNFILKCNRKGQSLYEVLRKTENDCEIIGGFALQVIYERGSTPENPKIAELYYVDISKLRWNADYTKLLYAKDWSAGKVKTIKFSPYDENDPTGTKIYYYSGTMTRDWYPVPEYVGSIPAIETAIDIANFNQNTLRNGFFPSVSITFFDGEPTEEEKGFIEKSLQEKWGGTSNTGRFMLFFADKDGKGAEITPIAQPDLDKRFSELKTSVIEDIFIGHRITDPSMFGLQVAGKLGNSDYTQSYAIFQNVFVKPRRATMLGIYNMILDPIMKDADLDILEIEPVNNVFKDEGLIASQMTQTELRKLLKKWGYIEEIEIPEGEQALIDTTMPTNEDDSSGAGGQGAAPGTTGTGTKVQPTIKISRPTIKLNEQDAD